MSTHSHSHTRETHALGMEDALLNILIWSGCTIIPVYDKGSKAQGDRHAKYHRILYPDGTLFEEDENDLSAYEKRARTIITLPHDPEVYPYSYPVILIQYGTFPEDHMFDYPFYFTENKRSTQGALDWYYHPQMVYKYTINFEDDVNHYICTCCGLVTPKEAGFLSRNHKHHPNCIHLKKKVE